MATEDEIKAALRARRNYRFPLVFDVYFAFGLLLAGHVQPRRPYSNEPGRVLPQERDEVTGKLMWTCPVTDPLAAAQSAKRGTLEVVFLSDTQPKQPTEVLGSPIVLENPQGQARLAGNGEFRYVQFAIFATGFAGPPNPGNRGSGAKQD